MCRAFPFSNTYQTSLIEHKRREEILLKNFDGPEPDKRRPGEVIALFVQNLNMVIAIDNITCKVYIYKRSRINTRKL